MKRAMVIAVALLLSACAGSTPDRDASEPTSSSTTSAVTTTTKPRATTTTRPPEITLVRAWLTENLDLFAEIEVHFDAIYAASSSVDTTELAVACAGLTSWSDQMLGAEPMPHAETNTHMQRIFTLAAQAADTCIRGAASGDAALIGQTTEILDDMNVEVLAASESIRDLTGR